jgi:hypothetical protein
MGADFLRVVRLEDLSTKRRFFGVVIRRKAKEIRR